MGLLSPLRIADWRFLQRVDTTHDAIRRALTHRLKAYSPERVEGVFSEVGLRLTVFSEVRE
jgi:hypothetical protein